LFTKLVTISVWMMTRCRISGESRVAMNSTPDLRASTIVRHAEPQRIVSFGLFLMREQIIR
jgi:hypothetical protein